MQFGKNKWSLNQIKDLMEMAVHYGVVKLELQNVKLEFNVTRALAPSQEFEFQPKEAKLMPEKVEIENEDLLFWSSEPESAKQSA